MTDTDLQRISGWSAWLSVVATLAGFVFLVAFFVAGPPFGALNDVTSVFGFLLTVPIALALHRLLEAASPVLRAVATAAGLAGMLSGALLQLSLVLGLLSFDQTLPGVLLASLGVGLWLLISNILARRSGALPSLLTWSGITSGVGYILLAPGFWLGGQDAPAFVAGSLLAVAGYVLWASWLGHLLLTRHLLDSRD